MNFALLYYSNRNAIFFFFCNFQQNWISDSHEYEFAPGVVTVMDVDDSVIQSGQITYQHVETKNTVKLGRKYLLES